MSIGSVKATPVRSSRAWRWLLSTTGFVVVLQSFLALPLTSQVVGVQAAKRGSGILMRGADRCFVITAKHVVSRGSRSVQVSTGTGTWRSGSVLHEAPWDSIDIAVIQPDQEVRCGSWPDVEAPLAAEESGYLSYANPSGDISRVPITIAAPSFGSQLYVLSKDRTKSLHDGMSGGGIYLDNGRLVGMLFAVEIDSGRGRGYNLRFVRSVVLGNTVVRLGPFRRPRLEMTVGAFGDISTEAGLPQSGRLEVAVPLFSALAIQVAGLRMVRDSADGTFAVLGLRAGIGRERLVFDAFAEAGYGRFYSRRDMGGTWRVVGVDTLYYPDIRVADAESLVFGGGASAGWSPVRPFSVVVTGGYWHVQRAPSGNQTPGGWSLGFGLRVTR